MNRRPRQFVGVSILLAISVPCFVGFGQDAVPSEMLSRTLYIRTATELGTAFKIDYKGKLYLITARHMVTGLPIDNPTIKVRQGDEWFDLHLQKILFPTSPNADIAIFKSGEDVAQPFNVKVIGDDDSVTFGQQVWFLGFPLLEGLESRATKFEAPFIKRGTMSAIVSTDPNAVVMFIDGFNNKGFSGGPVIYWDFKEHQYRILAVVSGYKNAQAEAVINGQKVDTNILVNSGILISYSIEHAMEAIRKDLDSK